MKPKNRRLAVSSAGLLIALAAGPLARATVYTFTGTTTGTTTWTSGTYWDAVPVSGSSTGLVFGTGETLASGTAIVTTQDIASPPFLLNSLTTSYSGSGTEPSVTIQTGGLNFVSDSAATPTIALNSTGGSPPQLVFSSAVNFGNNIEIGGASSVRFDGNITNTGGAVVTKTGAGTLRIASDNSSYTGNFNVNGGTLQIGNNGGTGDAGSGTVTLSGGAGFVVRRSSGSLTLNNMITGTGNVKFQTRNFTATINKANTYSGTTTLEPSSTTSPGGGIKLGIDNGLPADTAFTINNNGSTVYQTFNLNGFNQTLASLATGSGGNTTNSIVTNTGDAKTLTISNTTGSTTYAGLISGAIALTKSGASTQAFSGANSYTGATTINGGVLNITGSTASGSAVAVGGADATGTPTLSGSGSVNGAVTVKSAGEGAAGRLNAGDATSVTKVGTLAMGSTLKFETGSIFEWDINANKDADGLDLDNGTAGTDFDSVSVTGNIDVGTSAVFKVMFGTGVSMADPFWSTPNVTQTWKMITIFGKPFSSGSFSTVETSTNVSSYGSFTITAGGTALTWTAVPEPTTMLTGLLITAGLLRRRRSA